MSTIRTSSGRGLGLPELIVAIALFGLFTTMVARTLVATSHRQQQGREQIESRRTVVTGMGRLKRELMTVRRLDQPTPGQAPWWTPTAENPLIFHRNGEGRSVETRYWFEPADRQLRRWVEGEPLEGRVAMRGIDNFEFRHTPGLSPFRLEARASLQESGRTVTISGRAVAL